MQSLRRRPNSLARQFILLGLILIPGCRSEPQPAIDVFSEPLASTSKSAAGDTLFRELPADQTGLDFQMELYDALENIRILMFITAAGGICTGDYDGDGLSDIYVTSPVGGNRLYRNLGDLRFQDVTKSAGLFRPEFWGTGATFVDIDNDNDLDIYACGYGMPNQLWINRDGRFVEQAGAYGLDFNGASMTMAFADIDNDGDLDGYLATTAIAPPPGIKFGVRFEGNKPVIPEELREYWSLIYLPGERAHRTEAGQYDHLFRNDDGRFNEITEEAGIDGPYFTLSATWWDYNQDGFPDVYVSNDFMGPDKLYHNHGNGKFTDVLGSAVRHTPWFSMGSDLADLNNDGLLDFVATDMSATTHYRDKVMMGNMEDSGWFLDFAEPRQYMRNAVYLNVGTGKMLEVAFQAGLASSDWTWTPRLADFDNDGRVDVFTTNGVLRDVMNSDLSQMASASFKGKQREWAEFWAKQPMQKESNLAFRNLGDLKFEPVAARWGLDQQRVSLGAATADFDNDGDLDLVVNNADAKMSLLENRSDNQSRIRVRLKGTQSNRFGVGATVHVEAGGQLQTRYLTLARGWLSSCEPVLHFGLGDCRSVDKLTVKWPSGQTQSLTNLAVNQLHTITEPPKTPTQPPIARSPDAQVTATFFGEMPGFTQAQHREEPFDDFAVQPLLPNRQSQMGPALATADVDGDGDEDVFLGGSRGHPGQLLINDGAALVAAQIPALVEDAPFEDVDATFFDYDDDGDQDLWVVSGSNEWKPGARQFRDRLYRNFGDGDFVRMPNSLPDLRDNGSCVATGDVDGDGDHDVFVGGRALPGSYPLAAKSRLLINDGDRFTDRTPKSFDNLGIVTDAIWVDTNGDQQLDLVLSTEWGPVRCLINQAGVLSDQTERHKLGAQRGWWNSVDAADVDRDGDVDLLVTNFGNNTKYKATKEKPELLYFGDLDGTGKPHLVEAKFEDDRCLPRRGFSCSRNAMPFLTPKLKTFHNFANATLSDLYTQDRLDECQQFQVNTLQHGLFVNNGQAGFEFRPLPALAQVAPSMSSAFVDVDQDGLLDIVMAQNFYSPQRETGRMAGGLSLLLKGHGDGDFTPIWPRDSGIHLPHDTRRVVAADVNDDGRPDLIFAANNGPLLVLINSSEAPLASLSPSE